MEVPLASISVCCLHFYFHSDCQTMTFPLNKIQVLKDYFNSGVTKIHTVYPLVSCVIRFYSTIVNPDTRSDKKCSFNPLKSNDPYIVRTAPLTSKRYILYIYPTNIGTEYFKHGIYSPFFPLQNAVCFIILTYLVPVLFTFYIQGVLKLKK